MQPVAPKPTPQAPSRAWYSAPIADFLGQDPDAIIGQLARHSSFGDTPSQKSAWLGEISILKEHLAGWTGLLLLEFSIPRMGRRIDAVLLIGSVVFVLEFKVGETTFERAAREQVWDYALDLKNFHQGSHAAEIVPVLIATGAPASPAINFQRDDDGVYRPILVCAADLRGAIASALNRSQGTPLDRASWPGSPYSPTPTIIEAARALYGQHTVQAIARNDAGAKNLRVTSARVEELIDQAMAERRKIILFVTGVPGAGKTLVGLNVATRRRDEEDPTHAVYLSGNGPLVKVLQEALTRDEVARQKAQGIAVRKGPVRTSVKAFLQNVHHFRDELLFDSGPPDEHVTIFDEAQRAWNREQTANFMRRKKKRHDFAESEPEFLISGLDRHKDWAAIICLVGGGQEIHTGEAGIGAWVEAVSSRFPRWHLYVSPQLTDSEYAAVEALKSVGHGVEVHHDEALHLAVPMRSFRSEKVSSFVKALLDRDTQGARASLGELIARYPVALTRNLGRAKAWVRSKVRGSERYGLLASSKALRLKPDAIDIRVDIDPVHWFLADRDDTRSSYYLEDAATEFQVQGLELDWACVSWDGDLRGGESGWDYRFFRGKRWCRVGKAEGQRYLLNAYRVLLTRARQGMVIYVPPGDSEDRTREPGVYEATYRYLEGLGIPRLD